MKKHINSDHESQSQVHNQVPGFLTNVSLQAKERSFHLQSLFWFLGALAYGICSHLIFRARPDGFLLATVSASLLFLVIQLPLWWINSHSYLGGQRLSSVQALWLEIIRGSVTIGSALAAGYYIIDRFGSSGIAVSWSIAFALLIGHIVLSFIPYPLLLYLIFGLLTTVVSILSFNGMNYLLYGTITGGGSAFGWVIPKAVSWVLAVLFAYLTNRNLVFQASGNFWVEMMRFFLARIASGLLVEFLGLFILENLLGVDRDVSNLVISLIVVVVNYVFSRIFVFRKNAQP